MSLTCVMLILNLKHLSKKLLLLQRLRPLCHLHIRSTCLSNKFCPPTSNFLSRVLSMLSSILLPPSSSRCRTHSPVVSQRMSSSNTRQHAPTTPLPLSPWLQSRVAPTHQGLLLLVASCLRE